MKRPRLIAMFMFPKENHDPWRRVKSLPTDLSQGRYRLAHSHKLTKALGELIRTRNKLMHVDEPAKHLIGLSEEVKIEQDGIRVNFWRPLNPWGSVKLEKAKVFQQAVEAYFKEVLFPESGKIKQGTIAIPRR